MTLAQFLYVLRRRIKLAETEAIFIFVNNILPPTSALLSNLYEENNILSFTLSGVNVSIANSIRRIILSEIPCVVFKTTPHKENKVYIEKNTTRMNNELIKQRLACIPIFINDLDAPIDNYQVIINKKNTSDNIEFITTEDIGIIDKQLNKMNTQDHHRYKDTRDKWAYALNKVKEIN